MTEVNIFPAGLGIQHFSLRMSSLDLYGWLRGLVDLTVMGLVDLIGLTKLSIGIDPTTCVFVLTQGDKLGCFKCGVRYISPVGRPIATRRGNSTNHRSDPPIQSDTHKIYVSVEGI